MRDTRTRICPRHFFMSFKRSGEKKRDEQVNDQANGQAPPPLRVSRAPIGIQPNPDLHGTCAVLEGSTSSTMSLTMHQTSNTSPSPANGTQTSWPPRVLGMFTFRGSKRCGSDGYPLRSPGRYKNGHTLP